MTRFVMSPPDDSLFGNTAVTASGEDFQPLLQNVALGTMVGLQHFTSGEQSVHEVDKQHVDRWAGFWMFNVEN